MLGVVLVYSGMLALLAGGASLLWPLRWLGIATRKRGLLVLAAGILLFFLGGLLPAPLHRVAAETSRLDYYMPAYQFWEWHALRVHASPEALDRAIREVTADDIFLFRTLTWIRHPHWPGRGEENLMNAPARKPILDVMRASSFRMLWNDPQHEIVLGTIVLSDGFSEIHDVEAFRNFQAPGNAIAAINFLIRDDRDGWCTLSTETRVFATGARRRFARYWRVIYPGSSLLRYTWLRAVRRRAEAAR